MLFGRTSTSKSTIAAPNCTRIKVCDSLIIVEQSKSVLITAVIGTLLCLV